MKFKKSNLFQKSLFFSLTLFVFVSASLTPVFALPSEDGGGGFLPDGSVVGGSGSDTSAGGSTGVGKINQDKLFLPTDINDIIGKSVQLIYAVAGIVFFFMFLFGGLRYILAGGDEKAATAARATLTQAVIGLVIVVAAFLITQLLFTLFGIKGFIKLG